MDAYIEFRNVVKKFDDFVALDHVSLQIPKGAFVTLLGPSGCGKTTLMRQLAGFSEPEEGDVLVDGKRMNGLPPFKRNTPLVFQEYALFPHMTVYENISYGLKLKKAPKEEKDRKVAEMLEMFNLQGLDGRFPKQLSGGQQQRVAFARALVMGQEILLLDEPLSNLDAKLRVEVRTELRQIQQKFGITTMYVTHDQDEALSMSDIIAVMRRGRIEQIGSPMDIYETPASRLVCEFIGNVNLFDGVLVEDVQDHAVIACPQLENPIYIGHGISTRAEDKRITYALRPEKVMISAQKPDNLEHAGHNWAQGTVYDIAYLGGHSVYYIKLASGMIVQAFMANAERHVARPTWDQSVYISWYDDSGVVLQS